MQIKKLLKYFFYFLVNCLGTRSQDHLIEHAIHFGAKFKKKM